MNHPFRLHDDADDPNWTQDQPRDKVTLFWYKHLGKEPWYSWKQWLLMGLLMNPYIHIIILSIIIILALWI
jgi:hypothetical protein